MLKDNKGLAVCGLFATLKAIRFFFIRNSNAECAMFSQSARRVLGFLRCSFTFYTLRPLRVLCGLCVKKLGFLFLTQSAQCSRRVRGDFVSGNKGNGLEKLVGLNFFCKFVI